jgi:hypothetical protein
MLPDLVIGRTFSDKNLELDVVMLKQIKKKCSVDLGEIDTVL